jgi:hypothetical protein
MLGRLLIPFAGRLVILPDSAQSMLRRLRYCQRLRKKPGLRHETNRVAAPILRRPNERS